MGKFYAVRVGRKPGVYTEWAQVKPLVEGFPGAKHKSFNSRSEAEDFLNSGPTAVGVKRRRDDEGDGHHQQGHPPPQQQNPYDPSGNRASNGTSAFDMTSAPPAPQRYNPYIPVNCGTSSGPGTDRSAAPLANWQGNAPAAFLPTLVVERADPARAVGAPPAGVGAGRLPDSSNGGGSSGRGAVGGSRFDTVVEGPLQPISRGTLYQMEFDGAARGNPGQGGCGAVLRREDTKTVVCRLRKYMGGRSTNNEAEYTALLEGLRMARRLGVARLVAQGDSKLVVMQVKGLWKVNADNLKGLCEQVVHETRQFTEFSISHIRREWNTDADKLSNDAIDLVCR